MASRTNTQETGRGKSGSKMPLVTPAMPIRKTTAGARSDAPRQNTPGNALPERQQIIAQTAYFIAELRRFAPGNELDDWLQAEALVKARTTDALQ